jgi:peptidoglycan/xylan/chitin deacetylase (PgdA/CDA1 family)
MNYLRILTYHRVADLDETSCLNPRSISATPSVFSVQMKYLARYYNVVSMDDVFKAVQEGVQLPKRAVLITFDDGYYDFADIAWPILKRQGLTATVFVPTAYPDQPQLSFWWDRLYRSFMSFPETFFRSSLIGSLPLETSQDRLTSIKKLQNYLKTLPHEQATQLIDDLCSELQDSRNCQKSTMGWKELRRLAKEGVTLGSHTRTHPILTQVSPEKVREEVRGSIEDLKREIGYAQPIFCYPNGNYNDQIMGILKEEGILLAFTGKDGHNKLDHENLLCLRRASIGKRTSPFIFRLRLLRFFRYVDMWRHRQAS